MNNIETQLTIVCEAYKTAVYEKKAGAFLELYHPEARVFDTWETWSYDGLNSRKDVIEDWFSSLKDERVRVIFDRIQTVASDELATLSARVVYVALSSAGTELRSMQNRLTWVLKRQGGAWKIIHEHTSVPIGANDLKGKLQRE